MILFQWPIADVYSFRNTFLTCLEWWDTILVTWHFCQAAKYFISALFYQQYQGLHQMRKEFSVVRLIYFMFFLQMLPSTFEPKSLHSSISNCTSYLCVTNDKKLSNFSEEHIFWFQFLNQVGHWRDFHMINLFKTDQKLVKSCFLFRQLLHLPFHTLLLMILLIFICYKNRRISGCHRNRSLDGFLNK